MCNGTWNDPIIRSIPSRVAVVRGKTPSRFRPFDLSLISRSGDQEVQFIRGWTFPCTSCSRGSCESKQAATRATLSLLNHAPIVHGTAHVRDDTRPMVIALGPQSFTDPHNPSSVVGRGRRTLRQVLSSSSVKPASSCSKLTVAFRLPDIASSACPKPRRRQLTIIQKPSLEGRCAQVGRASRDWDVFVRAPHPHALRLRATLQRSAPALRLPSWPPLLAWRARCRCRCD